MKKLVELLRRKGIAVPDDATPSQVLELARKHNLSRTVEVTSDDASAVRNVPITLTKAEEGKSEVEVDRDVIKIQGIASTPEVDRHRDIISLAAWAPALPEYLRKGTLLLNHYRTDTIGRITEAKVDEAAEELRVSGEIYRDCIEEVEWNRIRRKLKSSLSVGIRVLEFEWIEVDDVVIFVITKLQLLEISVCTIPANPSADFDVVKTYEALAAKQHAPRAPQHQQHKGGDLMKEMLIKFLRGKGVTVADDVDDATLLALVSNLEKSGRAAILGELGLGSEANTTDLKAKLAGVASGDLVPKAQLEEERRKRLQMEADAAVAKALADGVIDNAQLEWAKEYALENPTGFAKFCEKSGPGARVPVDPITGADAGADPRNKDVAGRMTKAEQDVAKRLGLDVTKMAQLADTKPSEVIGKINGGAFKTYLFMTDTEYDAEVVADRKAYESPRRAA